MWYTKTFPTHKAIIVWCACLQPALEVQSVHSFFEVKCHQSAEVKGNAGKRDGGSR